MSYHSFLVLLRSASLFCLDLSSLITASIPPSSDTSSAAGLSGTHAEHQVLLMFDFLRIMSENMRFPIEVVPLPSENRLT